MWTLTDVVGNYNLEKVYLALRNPPIVHAQVAVQQLSIKFFLHSHSDDEDQDNPTENNFLLQNTAVIYFIQKIHNSSRELRKLEFTTSLIAESDLIPSELDLLLLPKSVTTLLRNCPVLAKHLEMMVPNDGKAISHLTKLEIMASEIPFPQITIHINRILLSQCGTLKEIKLSGKECQNVDVNLPSFFKMPPSMKNLEKITMTSPSWLCEDNFHMDAPSNYPNLTTVQMERDSLDLFKQITDKYRINLKTVKTLKVWLVRVEDAMNHFETTITLNLEHICKERICRALVYGEARKGNEDELCLKNE